MQLFEKEKIFCMLTNLPPFRSLSHRILIITNRVSLYESFRFYCSGAANFRALVRVSTYPTKGALLGRGASVALPPRGGNGHRALLGTHCILHGVQRCNHVSDNGRCE